MRIQGSSIPCTYTTGVYSRISEFCSLERPGQPVKYIREGYKKRVGIFLYCHFIIMRSLGLLVFFYSCTNMMIQNAPNFVSVKWVTIWNARCWNASNVVPAIQALLFTATPHPFMILTKASAFAIPGRLFAQNHLKVCVTTLWQRVFISPNPIILIAEVKLNLPQGVYLFLGFSRKDEHLLKAITNQGAADAWSAIQGLVSYHNVNNNKVLQYCLSRKATFLRGRFNSISPFFCRANAGSTC